jgi:methionyl-tRNA synthetase
VPIADPALAGKCIYVWIDAVIGYYSASIEWARIAGEPDAWRDWWVASDQSRPEHYYFLGKDNIPFHAIIWPALLIGHGDLVLPKVLVASEFMNLEGQQISTSRNRAVWLPDLERHYDSDAVRYYLAANAPENRDSNWSWREFFRRNDDELVATWGNLVNRVVSIAGRAFGCVPAPAVLGPADKEILDEVERAFDTVGSLIESLRFKAALEQAMATAGAVNRYISDQEPWRAVKADPARAATILYTGLRAIDSLKTLFSPFLPRSSQQIHRILGYERVASCGPSEVVVEDQLSQSRPVLYGQYPGELRWEPSRLEPGQPLKPGGPLFTKLGEFKEDESPGGS